MNRKLGVATLIGGTLIAAAAGVALSRRSPKGNGAVPQPAKPVDLTKYLGHWYEQFRYKAPFQNGMDEVKAEYSFNDDGTVKIINRGRKENGQWRVAIGKAKVVDEVANAKLKVSFFGPIYHGKYWILDHCNDYEWSIVGEPSGRYLWVLTREQRPGPELLQFLGQRVQELGYDWSLIRRTMQTDISTAEP